MAEAAQKFATRLNSFRIHGGNRLSVEEAVRAVANVPGVSAVELNYPQQGTAIICGWPGAIGEVPRA